VLALVAGSEIITRIGSAAVPGYMVRGFHPTSVCGVFGAAVAAARLHGLRTAAITSALGLTGSMAAGLFAYLADGSATKPVHAGWAAHAGVLASELAAAGAEGPDTVFEDRFGFFAAYYDQDASALEAQLSDLGQRFETPRIAFKPYPACHFVHSCLDAAASLLAEVPLRPGEISRITVAVPDPAIPLVLEPVAAKRDPRTEYDAKFSLQYSLAAMIVHGHVGVETYMAVGDPAVLELAARVGHVRREFPTYPRSFPGWVRIETRSGSVLERELAHQRGGPDNPMGREEIAAKFRSNAGLALGAEAVSSLEHAVLTLEQRSDVTGCFAPLRLALPAIQRA
jgi:2-methylcitrate dehydratase PrpD